MPRPNLSGSSSKWPWWIRGASLDARSTGSPVRPRSASGQRLNLHIRPDSFYEPREDEQ